MIALKLRNSLYKLTVLKLSVVIVNYNVRYFLEQCLCSVQKAISGLDAEIFVVDNHSTDGSREYLSGRFPKVHFRWNTDNLGFAKANNSVLAETRGEFILFLNPDTILPEDCFEQCFSVFIAHPDCGALGVRMVDGSGCFLKESKRSFPSPSTSFFKMIGLTKLFPTSRMFARYYAGHLPEHESSMVEVLAGAFMMLSRKALEKVQGFDEQFFMYGEDIDLSYRLIKSGFRNYYFPATTIIHFKGESTQKQDASYVKHFYGAMQLFVRKHYHEKKLLYFGMTVAIGLARQLANFRRKFTKDKPVKTSPSLLIVADQVYFNEMIQLVKFAQTPRTISGRVAIDREERHPANARLESLQAYLGKSPADEVLFCEGEMSFKSIIQYMQELKGKSDFLLHAEKSDSIVGSNDKTDKGIFIAKTAFV